MRYDGRVKAWPRTGAWLGWLWREWLRPLLVVGIVLGSFRSAVADWNDVPSGSMMPTILVGDRIFINGNDAAALGCVFGGATVAAWYPITPSSSLAEAFATHCNRYRRDPETKKKRYAIIQAEDELACGGTVSP